MDDTNNNTDTEIQDAEIVEETPATTTSDAFILENIESMIRENLTKIEQLTEETKKQKEMVDSVLLNDEVYQNHEEVVKQAQKVKNATKNEILKRPDVAHIVLRLKELKDEVKDIKESMTSYLQEYQRLSGSTEIEDEKGEVMQIIYIAKLVKRRA